MVVLIIWCTCSYRVCADVIRWIIISTIMINYTKSSYGNYSWQDEKYIAPRSNRMTCRLSPDLLRMKPEEVEA